MDFSLHFLVISLVVLILLSIFFSASEAAMLSINRYRLRHLVRKNHRLAKRVQQLLERPDRLLGVILLCDTFANIFASAIATLIAAHFFGTGGVMLATFVLTFVVLIFGEVAPKTFAALYPQSMAFIAAWPLTILLRILYPFVWFTGMLSNGMLRLFGIKVHKQTVEQLSHEELSTLLREGTGRIPVDYQAMLLKIMELGKVTVEDIMIPRQEIVGIDLEDDWGTILEQLTNSHYTRLPVYRATLDQFVGMLHLRKALNLLANDKLNKETLLEVTEEAYFIPESTPLNKQLLNFRHEKIRSGLVVNEYGDIQGLVTLEDILEEIVGEFTTDTAAIASKDIHPQEDGSYLVDGTITIRELNRALGCNLSESGPKTLNGLIVEYLEAIPHIGTALRLEDQPMEIMQVKDNIVKTVKILPRLTQ